MGAPPDTQVYTERSIDRSDDLTLHLVDFTTHWKRPTHPVLSDGV